MFFFSSRRRHTRWPRDWSSDVCSSDLVPSISADSTSGSTPGALDSRVPPVLVRPVVANGARSEERRVGKEGRSRWSQYASKNKKRMVQAYNKSASENVTIATKE